MKHLYIISGLGADERVFQRLDFSGYRVTYITWLTSFRKESLERYAKRLSESIVDPQPILIGISFGGMLATEIAKIRSVEKVILIASAKTRAELPPYYRLAGRLRLQKLMPVKMLKPSNFLSYWLFGVKKADRNLFAAILKDTDPLFLQWAINAILGWANITIPPNLSHIHGDADRILPIRFVKPDWIIAGGGHLMTLTKADQLSTLLRRLIG